MSNFRKMSFVLASILSASSLSAATGNTGWIGQWSPGIGDPSPAGWITVAAYLAAAISCISRGRKTSDRGGVRGPLRRERYLWTFLAVMLLFLGVNKQLDLQTAMTESLRILARSDGWYQYRGSYQLLFILALGMLLLAGLGALAYLTRRLSKWVKLSVAGSALIVCYVLARAASFHKVDILISTTFLSLKVNWILELGGISIVILGAMLRRRELRRVEEKLRNTASRE
jgi:hypothetical protein